MSAPVRLVTGNCLPNLSKLDALRNGLAAAESLLFSSLRGIFSLPLTPLRLNSRRYDKATRVHTSLFVSYLR